MFILFVIFVLMKEQKKMHIPTFTPRHGITLQDADEAAEIREALQRSSSAQLNLSISEDCALGRSGRIRSNDEVACGISIILYVYK